MREWMFRPRTVGRPWFVLALLVLAACADPGLRGSVHLSASDSRIRITPAEHPLDGAGIYAFEITPSRGASGGLEMWFQGSDGMVDVHLHGPRVRGDGDGWRFEARTP